MKIVSAVFNPLLSDTELQQIECSDKIYVHSDRFNTLMGDSEPGVLKLFRLENAVSQYVVITLWGPFHSGDTGGEDEKDTIYVPQWMMEELDADTEDVTITPYIADMCTKIVLQPHTSDHIKAEDPQEFLRDPFEHYSTVQMGQTLALWVGKQIHVTIQAVEPAVSAPLCIRNSEILLELLPPLDMPLPPPPYTPPPTSASENTIVESPSAPPQTDYRLDGTIPKDKTRQELMREAAIRRLKETSEHKS